MNNEDNQQYETEELHREREIKFDRQDWEEK